MTRSSRTCKLPAQFEMITARTHDLKTNACRADLASSLSSKLDTWGWMIMLLYLFVTVRIMCLVYLIRQVRIRYLRIMAVVRFPAVVVVPSLNQWLPSGVEAKW